nr:tyrosine-type recombinase/integrase [Sinorhizobium medicae]
MGERRRLRRRNTCRWFERICIRVPGCPCHRALAAPFVRYLRECNALVAAVVIGVRREEWLPLPQEVVDAILAHIERARPRSTSTPVITDIAPIRPLSIVCHALDRAGIESVHRGTHVLRHSVATAMLRNGASLAGVGAVLRHRFPSTTALYAKVDIGLLSEISQPHGGRLP